MSKTNIDYWERVIKNPRDSYKELFEKEKLFLTRTIKPNSRVLDIGCGDGRIISELKNIPAEIIGIDSDDKAIEDAQRRFSKEARIKIMKGDAFKLPFENEYFDHVLLMMTLVNFSENKSKALSEMKRVLTKSGSIIISVYSDNAFDERKAMYETIGVPISKITGTTFVFNKSVGANKSEQFSLKDLETLCRLEDLTIVNHLQTKIGLICEIKKNS